MKHLPFTHRMSESKERWGFNVGSHSKVIKHLMTTASPTLSRDTQLMVYTQNTYSVSIAVDSIMFLYLGEGCSQRWQSNQKRRHFPHTTDLQMRKITEYNSDTIYIILYTKPNIPWNSALQWFSHKHPPSMSFFSTIAWLNTFASSFVSNSCPANATVNERRYLNINICRYWITATIYKHSLFYFKPQ